MLMTHVALAAILPRLPLGKLCGMSWLAYGVTGGLEGGSAVVATPYRVSAGACGPVCVAASLWHLRIVVQGERMTWRCLPSLLAAPSLT